MDTNVIIFCLQFQEAGGEETGRARIRHRENFSFRFDTLHVHAHVGVEGFLHTTEVIIDDDFKSIFPPKHS